MRIEEIIIKNYRQYKNTEIDFKKQKQNDLFVIIGRNGTGKTNLLNAINWCLYYDEPHLSKESEGLPILNLQTIQESKAGEIKEVLVKVGVRSKEGNYFTFERKDSLIIDETKKHPRIRETKLTVSYTDLKGNTKFAENEDATNYVDRFFPKRIREFFFFDGERLDSYFKEAKAQNISYAIFEISQIDLLDKIGKNLETLTREYAREMGRTNPQINETENRLEKAKDSLSEYENRIKQCKEQIEAANNEIIDCTRNLTDTPDVKQLEKDRQEYMSDKEIKEKILEEKIVEKNGLLIEYGKIVYLLPAIKNALKVINERRSSGEIPPSIDKDLLKEIINNEICKICDRKLDAHSKEHINILYEKINLSSTVAQTLLLMEVPLKQYFNKMDSIEKEIERRSKEIQQYEDDLIAIDNRMSDIEKKMSGYDAEKIKKWYQRRSEYENVKSNNEEKVGIFKAESNRLKKDIEELKSKLNEEMAKEKKSESIRIRVELCNKANRIVSNAQEHIMQETRKEIEKETKKIFFDLLWKKETFSDVIINPDYSISLIHSMGYECLGTMGAAERELLALAFTLALHKASGFDCPILIDTPVARVADEHRENFAKIFSEVSIEKQTILLFTSAEYSHEISNTLDKKYSGKSTLNMSSNEKETKIGV